MNPYRLFPAFVLVAFVAVMFHPCQAQVVVNGKNLNNDRDLEYIQLMYYIDKSSIKPVFFVDYGFIEPEYTDILDPEHPEGQTISINGEPLTDRVTVVWVLNKMNKAGWEYIGDVVFIELKVMNDWHVYTLRRKKGH